MPDNIAVECFVDSNVWLYAFIDADDPQKSATARILRIDNTYARIGRICSRNSASV